jgi:hypothetical protein
MIEIAHRTGSQTQKGKIQRMGEPDYYPDRVGPEG